MSLLSSRWYSPLKYRIGTLSVISAMASRVDIEDGRSIRSPDASGVILPVFAILALHLLFIDADAIKAVGSRRDLNAVSLFVQREIEIAGDRECANQHRF
ncbi:hypothetical protein [Mesorhizobium sp.]|uniref:hypothetical protein n=1 Tax=Mesorhizobium sp. TaxID=1871066 RepID=UPI0025FA480E|nr:hypothetical protein [Mesorhizobium sp.]